jgi:glycosyltransferase involved in cell wall biosynthesis
VTDGIVSGAAPRLALCIEQTLGHRTHGQNIERALEARAIDADLIRVHPPTGRALPMPWALRASLDAARQLRARGRVDVTFFHTQTLSLFAPLATRGGRYIVSVDATPVQIDAMGTWYDHGRHDATLESVKREWYRRIFDRAAGIVTWSDWAAESLRSDYGTRFAEDGAELDAAGAPRLLVAHPGAPTPFFEIPRAETAEAERPVRILFVGGDFERKGGPALLEARRRLGDRAELMLVTGAEIAPEPGVSVVPGVQPGSAALLDAFARADIFCLPTLGDCTPVVLGEAMAAGLPVVTTELASNPEWVPDEAGSRVPPGDAEALYQALRPLVDDPELRVRRGRAARAHAAARMSSDANATRILDFLAELAERPSAMPAGASA